MLLNSQPQRRTQWWTTLCFSGCAWICAQPQKALLQAFTGVVAGTISLKPTKCLTWTGRPFLCRRAVQLTRASRWGSWKCAWVGCSLGNAPRACSRFLWACSAYFLEEDLCRQSNAQASKAEYPTTGSPMRRMLELHWPACWILAGCRHEVKIKLSGETVGVKEC